MEHILLLGSKSQARQMLLHEAQIPFILVEQDADETFCDVNLPLEEMVTRIADYKMQHVILPEGQEGQQCFVLTADTLSCDAAGTINGKPVDYPDAVRKIKAARALGARIATAFCLHRKVWHSGAWHMQKALEKCVTSYYKFVVPDERIDSYLKNSFGWRSAGALAVEKYGAQFLFEVRGSYSNIVGLPMFEFREALESLGFFLTEEMSNLPDAAP